MPRLLKSFGLILAGAAFTFAAAGPATAAAHTKPVPKVHPTLVALACVAADGSIKITNNGSRGWGAFDRIGWKAGRMSGSFGAPVNWQKGSSLVIAVAAIKKGIACSAWVPPTPMAKKA